MLQAKLMLRKKMYCKKNKPVKLDKPMPTKTDSSEVELSRLKLLLLG
jgi:hypothetical protein